MKGLLAEFGKPAWDYAWAFTGNSRAAAACLARAFRRLDAGSPPAREPDRRRALWRAVVDACREQVTAKAPGAPESRDARLLVLLDLPLEVREALLLLRFHAASADDLAAVLGCRAEAALARAQRGLGRIALALLAAPSRPLDAPSMPDAPSRGTGP